MVPSGTGLPTHVASAHGGCQCRGRSRSEVDPGSILRASESIIMMPLALGAGASLRGLPILCPGGKRLGVSPRPGRRVVTGQWAGPSTIPGRLPPAPWTWQTHGPGRPASKLRAEAGALVTATFAYLQSPLPK